MRFNAVSYKKEGHVAILQFAENSERQIPILSVSTELLDICTEIVSDWEVRVVAVFGVENLAFALDRNDIEKYLIPGGTREIRLCSIAEPVADLECPVIVGINGNLYGQSLELALAGDIRVSSTGSRFCLPHVTKGFIPWDGGGQRLSRIVGKTKAMEIILTGEVLDAAEAFRIGIVSRIVSSSEVKPVVMDIALKMAANGPIALKYAKEAIVKGLDMSLEQGLRLEADLYALLQTTSDRTEGVEAFRRKTTPNFKGE